MPPTWPLPLAGLMQKAPSSRAPQGETPGLYDLLTFTSQGVPNAGACVCPNDLPASPVPGPLS